MKQTFPALIIVMNFGDYLLSFDDIYDGTLMIMMNLSLWPWHDHPQAAWAFNVENVCHSDPVKHLAREAWRRRGGG